MTDYYFAILIVIRKKCTAGFALIGSREKRTTLLGLAETKDCSLFRNIAEVFLKRFFMKITI